MVDFVEVSSRRLSSLEGVSRRIGIADPRPDRVERLSVHIHGLASGAAGVCMIRPTHLTGRTRRSSSQLRATSGRLHWSLQCPFVAERRW